MLTWDNIQSNAVAFSKRWKDAHNEEAQAQSFTTDFLQVFGVSDPEAMGVSEQFGQYYARLPLTQSATIVHGNALRIDWESVVPKRELSYILGNPPFVGKKEQSQEQKAELMETFENQKGVGVLDYVSAWYKKAVHMISSTSIRVAFVSTNSISQGEQPAVLWKTLLDDVKIDFAYRTFKWSNEAKGKAAVHCVIIGFSQHSVKSERIILPEFLVKK